MIKLHHLLSITLLLSPVITTCSDYGVLTEYNNNRVTKVEDFAVFSQQELGKISLYHNDNDKSFIVEKENTLQEVKSYFVDKTLVKMTTEQLQAFQKTGYISVKQLSDGELSLLAKTRGPGGGPALASAAYWGTKVALYTAFGLTMAGTAVGTGVLGTAALAVALPAAGTTTALGTAAFTFCGVELGFWASMSATAIATAKATVLTLATSGMTIPVAIETVCLGAAAAGMAVPGPF